MHLISNKSHANRISLYLQPYNTWIGPNQYLLFTTNSAKNTGGVYALCSPLNSEGIF